MVSRRLIIVLVLLAAASAALFVAVPGARHGSPPAATTAAGNAALPHSEAGPAGTAGGGATSALDGRARLEAVRTVKLFCDLVDGRRLWDAAGLFAGPRLWTRAQLRTIEALTFRSARVLTEPDPATVTVAARVEAVTRPGGPVPAGAVTLLVTLGRVGSTEGGWLIQAITARLQPQRKGSQ